MAHPANLRIQDVQGLNVTSGNVEVTINLSANLTIPTSVLILGLYDEWLSLSYYDQNRIMTTPALMSTPVAMNTMGVPPPPYNPEYVAE